MAGRLTIEQTPLPQKRPAHSLRCVGPWSDREAGKSVNL